MGTFSSHKMSTRRDMMQVYFRWKEKKKRPRRSKGKKGKSPFLPSLSPILVYSIFQNYAHDSRKL